MRSIFSPTHVNDILTLSWMFTALTAGYRHRVKALHCAALFLLCLAGCFGSILLQERFFQHYGLYMLLFVLWGIIYGAVALKGALPWKAAMAAVYGCVVFHLGKCARLVVSWLPESYQTNRIAGFAVFQIFAILAAVFLSRHVVTTERKVPAVSWVSLMGVSLIGIWFAYYQMTQDHAPEFALYSALYSLAVVAIVMVVEHLCARVILSHERDLVRLSLGQSGQEQAVMARQISRTEEEFRRYRHETNNHLNALSALLYAGEIDKAQTLIRELTASPTSKREFISSNNPLVDALFSQKQAVCREAGISFSADLVLSDHLPLTDAEISSLLGNLLNNAIEAARLSPKPYVRTRIYPARDYLCIEVENSADENRLRRNPALNTTKDHPELHGIGLKVIQEIADLHQGMTFFEPSGSGQFTARVLIHL